MRRVRKCLLWVFAVICMCGQMSLYTLADEMDCLPDDAGEMHTEYVDLSDRIIQAGGYSEPSMNHMVSAYGVSARDQLKAEIYQALKEKKAYVAVNPYGYTIDDLEEIQNMFIEVINENPELFYVESYIGYSCYTNGLLGCLYFHYIEYTDEEISLLNDMIEQALSWIRDSMSDEEKALVLHDYLAQNCAYAYQEYLDGNLPQSVYTAYGALVDRRAVCQGYALAYSILLRKVGIESYLSSSDEMNHVWNVILIDGEWYHVDVTWDDPAWNVEGQVLHQFFLLSDAEMENRAHSGWTDNVECTSTKYDAEDYWWYGIDSKIYVGENKYYYIDYGDDYRVLLLEKDGDNISVIYKGHNLQRDYGYMSSAGEYFYFNNSQHLYAMHIADGTPQIIYTYDGTNGYVYGAMVYADGTARLNVSQYYDTDKYVTIDLKKPTPVLDINYDTRTISTTAAMVYSTDGGNTWNQCTENMLLTDLGWIETKKTTVMFKVLGEGGYFDSEVAEITIQAMPGITTGIVNIAGDSDDIATIQLMDANGVVAATTTVGKGDAEYALGRVNAGTYTMQVSKKNYVTREYTVEIGDEALTLDVEIHLIGDINGDGSINARDKKMMYNHISGSTLLEDYDLMVGDINGDGSINARDKKMLYNHIAGISNLWE